MFGVWSATSLTVLLFFESFRFSQAQIIIPNGFPDSNDANCPINIPGFTHHGDCSLLCGPISWVQVLIFILTNYIAHAATITSIPGQSNAATIYNIGCAVFSPVLGSIRGIHAICSLAAFAKTDLRRAARAGALCTVVKLPTLESTTQGAQSPSSLPDLHSNSGDSQPDTSSLPDHPDEVVGVNVRSDASTVNLHREADAATTEFEGSEDGHGLELGLYRASNGGVIYPPRGMTPSTRPMTVNMEPGPLPRAPFLIPREEPGKLIAAKIHGVCRLPRGYCLRMVEESDDLIPSEHVQLAANYNVVGIIAALAQLGSAAFALYSASADQIARYSIGSPIITVSAYAWVSMINLIGNLVRPQYDRIYIVESDDLRDLQTMIDAAGDTARKLFVVTGTVGRLQGSTDSIMASKKSKFWVFAVTLVISLAPLSIVIAVWQTFGIDHAKISTFQKVGISMWFIWQFLGSAFTPLGRGGSVLHQGNLGDVNLSFSVFSFLRRLLYAEFVVPNPGKQSLLKKFITIGFNVFVGIFWITPAILMFVSTALVLTDFGTCFKLMGGP